MTDPDEDIPTEDLTFEVDGVQWPFFEKAIILLNKPEHYECSLKPIHHPSVLSLLPPPLRVRKVQPVGRLDEDTTGLLLLTDDGKLIHRLTHPKKHVTKIYRVTLKHPVTEKQIAQLLKGVQLADSPDIVKAVSCEKLSELVIDLGITQGKYVHNYVHHFVKVEDAADAAIMFKNGCLYNLYACNIYGTDSPINIELIGERRA